jgi:CBS domain containing-hemolysin-like protein
MLNGLANAVLRLFRVEPKDETTSAYTREQVAGIIEQSQREGTLSDNAGPLTSAFEFTDQKASDIEVPLADMVLLPPSATPADVQRAVIEHGYSRYVLADKSGEPTAYLHMKDVMEIPAEEFHDPVPPKRLRRLIAIHRDAELEDALSRMRQQGSHVAMSVDHEGTARGLLFLEDAIEVLVGEIHDGTAA